MQSSDAPEAVEHTLSVLPQAHVYKLPPRPSAGGWQCQQWPKESHIFSGKVVIVAVGSKCTVRLIDEQNGSLFAQCPLDNDNPQVSVEPVADSSRYFVLRVADNKGRHAFLGMGFVERAAAFELNVTLQDHVRRLKNEKEAEIIAAAPAPPPQDFTLKGSVSIALPGGATSSKRSAPSSGAAAGLSALAPPPPSTGGSSSQRGRRPVAGGAPPPPPPPPPGAAAASASSAPDISAAFGDADPFAAAATDPFAAAADPFAAAADPFASAASGSGGFCSSDPFTADAFAPSSVGGGAAEGGAAAAATFEPAKDDGGGWVSFG